ncbi:hypothetical protein TSPI_06337 [Trichinella spiralis]|uniref:Uncharacterized protein n=1 Tax=Trichinella spiralis TaxID=6334 RepID=A0ABR3KHC9_TRISP
MQNCVHFHTSTIYCPTSAAYRFQFRTGKNYRLFAYFEHIRSNGVSKDCVSCKLDKAVLCSAQRKNKEKSSEKRRKRKQHRRLYTTSAALPSPLLRRPADSHRLASQPASHSASQLAS